MSVSNTLSNKGGKLNERDDVAVQTKKSVMILIPASYNNIDELSLYLDEMRMNSFIYEGPWHCYGEYSSQFEACTDGSAARMRHLPFQQERFFGLLEQFKLL